MDCPRCGGPIPEDEKDLCPYCFYLLSQVKDEGIKKLETSEAEKQPNGQFNTPGDYDTINVFGVKMKVKKKGWTQLLSMDAKEALTGEWALKKESKTFPTEDDIEETSSFKNEEEFIAVIEATGKKLGLQQEGNFWIASQGLKIFIKPVFEKVKREGVNELIEMFLPQRVTISDYGTSLFITSRQKDAGVVLAAIKTKNALHLMNVISFYLNRTELHSI